MKLLFWLRSRKTQTIVNLRITINAEQLNRSTEIPINAKEWISSENFLNPISNTNIEINKRLLFIKNQILKAYNDLIYEEIMPSSIGVYERYLSNQQNKQNLRANDIPTIGEVIIKMLDYKASQVGVLIEKSTLNRYLNYNRRFTEFIKQSSFNISMPITRLTFIEVQQFVQFLKITQNKKNTTINKFMDFFRLMIEICEKEYSLHWRINLRPKDLERLPEPEPEIMYLTQKEQEAIRVVEIPEFLQKVRDILFFLIGSGIHISDYRGLRTCKIIEKEGHQWIIKERKKTKVKLNILLEPCLLEIINKYGGLEKLPIISDQRLNDYFKILALRAGVDKPISTKVGKKTFFHNQLDILGNKLESVSLRTANKGTDTIKRHYYKENPFKIIAKDLIIAA